jgi:hypothetical protein
MGKLPGYLEMYSSRKLSNVNLPYIKSGEKLSSQEKFKVFLISRRCRAVGEKLSFSLLTSWPLQEIYQIERPFSTDQGLPNLFL